MPIAYFIINAQEPFTTNIRKIDVKKQKQIQGKLIDAKIGR